MIHAEAVMEESVAVEAGSTWVLIVSNHIDAMTNDLASVFCWVSQMASSFISRIDVVTDARRRSTCNDLGLREPRA